MLRLTELPPIIAAFWALVVVLIPAILLWGAGLALIPFSTNSECEAGRCWYPVLTGLAGLCLAIATIAAAGHVHAGAILGAQGWWQVESGELLSVLLPELLVGMGRLFMVPLGSLPDLAFLAVLGFLVALTALGGLIWAKGWPVWTLAAALPVAIGVASVVLYALAVLLWLVATLNFWLFGVALIYYQHWRHRPRRAVMAAP